MKVGLFFLLSILSNLSFAAEQRVASQNQDMSTELTIWLGVCTALVLIMQIGFLLLEAGMVRSKNTINVILKNFSDMSLGTLGYWFVGFGLMFGASSTGWFGTTEFMPNYAGSEALNFLYQVMFAATAATIVSGAVAERFSFVPYIIGAFFITALIYPLFGAWAWGGDEQNPGWLRGLGFYDAAGATVVHSIGGWCALGALLLIGPRHGRYSRKGDVHDIPGHNLPLVAMGGFFLWFGWFGFNGGAVNDDFSNLGEILLNTHMGSVGGIAGAVIALVISKNGFIMTRIVNGALGGLVSVTGAVDVLTPATALATGFIGGIILVMTSNLLDKVGIDDVVGAIPVHGFCGAWGTMAVAFFYHGDMFNIERIIAQLVGVFVAFIWGVSMSYGIFWTINKVMDARVTKRQEQRGLDISEHKEIGYSEFVVNHARADK